MSRRSICRVAGSMLLTVACSGSGTATFDSPGGTGGATDSDGLAGTGGSGGVWEAGLGGFPGAAEPQDYRQMNVSVEQGVTGRGTPFSRVIVSLSDTALPGFPEIQVIDNCEITDLRDFWGYPTWAPTAGTIFIEQEQARDIVMGSLQLPGRLPAPDLYAFEAPEADVPRWAPGDELFIHADGDEVQSFRAKVEFPALVGVRTIVHREVQNRLPTLHRDRALRVFWSPTEEQVGVSIFQYRTDAPERLAYCVRCAFPGDQGFGRITARALEGLDDDDVLDDESSRTEAYVNGLTMVRLQKEHADVVITLNHGTGFMLNVK